jgi:hypothetical protein
LTYVVELDPRKVIHDPELDEYRQPSPMRFTIPRTGEYRGRKKKEILHDSHNVHNHWRPPKNAIETIFANPSTE